MVTAVVLGAAMDVVVSGIVEVEVEVEVEVAVPVRGRTEVVVGRAVVATVVVAWLAPDDPHPAATTTSRASAATERRCRPVARLPVVIWPTAP